MHRLKIVVDTNVFLAMIRDPSDVAARNMFEQVFKDLVHSFISHELWGEYQVGAWHPATLEKRSIAYIDSTLDKIAEHTELAVNVPHQANLERHPKDNHIINLAIYKEVDFVATKEKRLLALNENLDWQEWFPKTRFLEPNHFTTELSLWRERQRTHECNLEPEF